MSRTQSASGQSASAAVGQFPNTAFAGSLRGYMLTGACRIAAILQLGMCCQFAVTLNV
jgi:hypothetical protein